MNRNLLEDPPRQFRTRSLALFPGVALALLAIAFLSPGLENRPILAPVVLTLIALSITLLVLAAHSLLTLDQDGISNRFFSVRSTTIRWDQIRKVTYGMSFPSLAFGLKLRTDNGSGVFVHLGYWRSEESLFQEVGRKLAAIRPETDRQAAELVGFVTRSAPLPSSIEHIPWIARGGRAKGNWQPSLIAPWLALIVVAVVIVEALPKDSEWLPRFVISTVAGVAMGLVSGVVMPRTGGARIVWTLAFLLVPMTILLVALGRPGAGYVLGAVAAWLATRYRSLGPPR